MERGGKLVFSIILILSLILSTFIVFAANETENTDTVIQPIPQSQGFDQAKSYLWLYNNVKNVSFPDVDKRALSTIALIQGSNSNMKGLVEALKDKEDRVNGCWPSGGCKVKDTALATLALALSGQTITKEVEWLKNSRMPGINSGEWQIVLKASSNNNGTCQFSAKGSNKTFEVQEEKIKFLKGSYTSGQYYINLNELSPSLKSSVQPIVDVSCDPSLNPIVTLIYKPNQNTFFIQRSDPASNIQLKVANACFGTQSLGSACSYESTAYATWALVEIGSITQDSSLSLENIGTHIYLESQVITKNKDTITLAFLNRILYKSGSVAPSFINDLVKLQNPRDGSFGDIISTSVASFSLAGSDKAEAVIRANTYLTDKVSKDGSWGNNVEATSWALIALHGGELSRSVIGGGDVPITSTEICGNGIDDDQDGALDCAESECLTDKACACANGIKDEGEEGIDCGGSCATSCIVDEKQTETPAEKPEEVTPVEETPPTETPKESSSWWIWLLVILVLLGLVVLFYIKYIKSGKIDLGGLFKKKPKGPSFEDFRRQAEFRPIQQRPSSPGTSRPSQPVRPMTQFKTKSKEEDELEKSMREAEKLLKG